MQHCECQLLENTKEEYCDGKTFFSIWRPPEVELYGAVPFYLELGFSQLMTIHVIRKV